MIAKLKNKWYSLQDRERKLISVMIILIIFVLLYYYKSIFSGASTGNNIWNSFFKPAISNQVNIKKAEFDKLLPSIAGLQELQKKQYNYTDLPDDNLYVFISNQVKKINLLLLQPETDKNLDTNQQDEVKQDNKVINNPQLASQNDGKIVTIKYQAVSFDDLINWLEKINNQYGIAVKQASFTSTIEQYPDKPGYVDAEIILK